jgi:hypothetical protein
MQQAAVGFEGNRSFEGQLSTRKLLCTTEVVNLEGLITKVNNEECSSGHRSGMIDFRR